MQIPGTLLTIREMEKEKVSCPEKVEGRISVIIPTYNSAPTLGKALDSVLSQDYPDIEIIVVDDGSRDSTPDILHIYQERSPELKNIRILNSGPGKARWEGLSHASGEYIQFLDSDDTLLPGALSALMTKAKEEELDIVELSFVIRYPNGTETESSKIGEGIRNGKDALALNFNGGYWSLWSRFTKTELFAKVEYRGEDLKFGEDLVVSVQLLGNAKRVGRCDTPALVYNVGEGSLSTDPSKSLSRRRDMEKYSSWVHRYLDKENSKAEMEVPWHMFRKYILLLMLSERWYDGIDSVFKELAEYIKVEGLDMYSELPHKAIKIINYYRKFPLLGQYKLRKYIRQGKL